MPFDFDTPIDRRGTDAEKWRRFAGRDVIPLWVADMDFASPPAVIAALRERVDHGVYGYASPGAELVAVVREHLRRDFDWEVAAEWLIWLPGLVAGIAVACRALGEAGDTVVTHTPIYPPFLSVPAAMRFSVAKIPLRPGEQRWEIDWAATEIALADPHARLFLLCSPHNPCGRVWSHAELERLAGLCLENDVAICSDEIHNQLVLDTTTRQIPTALLGDDVARRTITLMAPSKTYNIAGLGCSFAVIPDDGLRRRYRRAMAGILPHVNIMGYVAAHAAYRDGDPWRRALLEYLREGRDMVQAAVADLPPLTMTPVEATYLAWVDVRGLGREDPTAYLEEHGLGVSDGGPFGAPGFVRLNFGCPHATLREALVRLHHAVGAAG